MQVTFLQPHRISSGRYKVIIALLMLPCKARAREWIAFLMVVKVMEIGLD